MAASCYLPALQEATLFAGCVLAALAATDQWPRSFPLQVFQFANEPGPRPGFLERQVSPWDLTSAPLSLSKASCQGDDRIGFRVKGTNLVFLILSLLSLPPIPLLPSCPFSLFYHM